MLHALDAVRSPIFGVDRHPSLEEKACAVAYAIIRGHVFTDGNKRTGTAVLFQILELNGRTLEVDEDSLVAAIEDVAVGSLDLRALVAWVRERLR